MPDWGYLLASVTFLIGALILALRGGRLGPHWLRNLGLWILIGLGLAVLYMAFGHLF